MPTSHIERFTVRSFDLDAGGALSVGALLGFLQEAAGIHAEALGVGMARMAAEDLTWMLSRMTFELLEEAPRPGHLTELAVETWPSGFDRAFALRELRVTDEQGRAICLASSRWVVVSLSARRAIRIPDLVRRIPFEPSAPLVPAPPRLPDEIAVVEGSAALEVRRSDLDLLAHVNNVRYAEWALEALPGDVFLTHELASLDLQFRAEAVHGDCVVSEHASAAAAEQRTFHHRIKRTRDGEALARAVSRWRPRVWQSPRQPGG